MRTSSDSYLKVSVVILIGRGALEVESTDAVVPPDLITMEECSISCY